MDVFKNLLLSNPRTYTGSGVGLLEASNNLSDVGDATTARNNLSVFSKAESNTRLNALAPRQGVVLNGIGALAVGPTYGADAFTWNLKFVCPTANPSADVGIAMQGGSTTAVGNSFEVYINISGSLVVFLRDLSGNSNSATLSGFVSANAGRIIDLVVVRNASGNPTFYLNGVSTTFTFSASGTPPTWQYASIGTNFILGSRLLASGGLPSAYEGVSIFNFALPATTTSGVVGVAERYADGVWVRPSERGVAGGISGAGFAFFAATDGGTASTSKYDFATTSNFGSQRIDFAESVVANQRLRVKLSGVSISGGVVTAQVFTSGATAAGAAVTITADGVYNISGPTTASSGIRLLLFNSLSGQTTVATVDSVELLAATLDLIPQGIGRTLIDRSASRNHATVSGTALPQYLQPTDGGKIVARTSTNGNQQLQAAAAFDAASRYRITSWTVTALTGTPTISLGNASAGTQYVSGLTLATGVPTAVTLATSIAATANLWCNSNSTDVIIHSITYERVSD